MTVPQPPPRFYTIEEYLRIERDSSQKHEYHNGQIVAMSGGTPEHSLLIANIIATLHAALRGKPCRVYDSNLRVTVARAGRYFYPDATILCTKPTIDPKDDHDETITNPRVVIEVLSPSTESYDRGEKFDCYRLVDSLEEYVLVSTASARVETFLRQPDGGWVFNAFTGLAATARLRSVEVDLRLAEAYAGVDLPPPPPPPDIRERENL